MYQEWKKLKKRYKLGIVMIPVGLVFFLSGGWASMLVKAETQVLDVTWGEGTAFDRPLQVTLRAGVNREVKLVTQPEVPLVEVERVVEVGVTGFEYRVSLKPLEPWEPGVRYRVVAQVDNVDVASTSTVDVPKLSEPKLVSVTNEASRCLQSFAYSHGDLNGVVEVQATLEPVHEVVVTTTEEGVVVDPAGCLMSETTYSLSLSHRLKGSSAEFVPAATKQFTTNKGTAVAEVVNATRHVAAKPEVVKLVFTGAMNQASLAPSISGGSVSGSWLDAQTYTMTLGGLSAGESYQISFPEAKDAQGDPVSLEPVTVATYGAVSATLGPSGSKVGVDAQLTVAFDQPVDQAQAQQLVGVSPEVAFSTSWVGNKLILTPKEPLKKGADYTLYVLPGVPSSVGLPSSKKFTHSFTTEPNSVQLGVVFDRQDRKLSCEVASLKMALKVKGVYVSEDELMGHVGYVTQDARGETWGNPHLGFVGSIDGKQNSTGYGVYWDPIASAANHYRPSYARTGMTVQELAAAIDAGHPVVTWGVYPGGKKDGWFTPEGTWIDAWVGEHVRVVGGYEGSVDNPTSFTVIDPVSGVQVWSTKKLLADWATFGNAGVIVK